MNKKRILFMTQLPPPIHGVTVISRQLVESGRIARHFLIDILPMRFSRSIEQIEKLSLAKLFVSIWLAMRLFSRCMLRRPALVYFTLTPAGRSFYRDLLYVSVIKLLFLRPAYHLHGLGVRAFASTPLRRFLYRWVFRNAWVILLSERLYDDVEEFVSPDQCRYLTNGIPDPVDSLQVERVGDDRPVRIMFLSQMILQKGPVVLLHALGRLKQRDVRFHAVFAGGRFLPDCREQFNAIIDEYDLHESVEYVGEVHGDDKERLFRESDVFVFPSMYDAFGLVVLEAMARGLPVVSTLQGAIPDMVADGETGYLVPVNDPDELADRLERLAADPGLRARLGRAGRARFTEKFTLACFEENAVKILEECAEHAPGQ